MNKRLIAVGIGSLIALWYAMRRRIRWLRNSLAHHPEVHAALEANRHMLDLLRESEERYRQITEQSPDMLAIHSDGLLVYINFAGARLLGAAHPEELLGRAMVDIVTPAYHNTLNKHQRPAALPNQAALFLRQQFIRLDGTLLDVEVTTLRISWRGQPATQMVARDMSAQVQAERRLKLLAEAGVALASSLDYETTLRNVANLAVPAMADLCAIYLQMDDQPQRHVAFAVADPAKFAAAAEIMQMHPIPATASSGYPQVVRSGQAELVAHLPPDWVDSIASSVRHLELLRSLNLRSAITVPIRIRDETVGAMQLRMAESGRVYNQEDVILAEELARRAAQAIQHALLYRQAQHDLAERQRAEGERQAIEHKLFEAQKSESLGVVVGGIAHDFNNLLAVILGNTHLALADLDPQHPAYDSIEQITSSSRRASDLIGQMLAYAGKGHFDSQPLEFNELLEASELLLQTSIPSVVTLHYELATNLPLINGDLSQLQQLVMNVVLNAAEAFDGQHGLVSLHTSVAEFNRMALARMLLGAELPPGRYLSFEVVDNGKGMDTTTRAHIFDPFFTTKFSGRGLGLAAVLGIVRRHRGALHVTSQPGVGTTFQVILPLASTAAQPASSTEARILPQHLAEPRQQPAPLAASGRGDKVLVVDDEAGVREVIHRILQREGLVVLTAASGNEALALFQSHQQTIACVLLDLTMPGLSGAETLSALHSLRPGLPVVLMSGYDAKEALRHIDQSEVTSFLHKPFSPTELKRCLARVLVQLGAGSE